MGDGDDDGDGDADSNNNNNNLSALKVKLMLHCPIQSLPECWCLRHIAKGFIGAKSSV